MRIHLAVLRVIVFVVLARSCSFAEAQKIVKRVVIYSYAGGLGGGSNTAGHYSAEREQVPLKRPACEHCPGAVSRRRAFGSATARTGHGESRYYL